jgi:spermidine synthase
MVIQLRKRDGELLYRERNFYGALRVSEQNEGGIHYLELLHGRILHGAQIVTQRDLPTTYYDRDSGVGLAIMNHPRRKEGMRVGAIGLGTGTLAAYAKPGDVYRFYEINPAVIRLARGKNGYFTFLKSARGEVETVLGDARLSLQAEVDRGDFQQFDVLVVDAFNGDSIPVHLLTREAFRLYREHLRDNESVIAVHVSNIAVDLQPVVAGLADEFGMQATLIKTEERSSTMLSSYWVLVSNGQVMYAPAIRLAGQPMVKAALGPPKVLWTDDYSNVASLFEHGDD